MGSWVVAWLASNDGCRRSSCYLVNPLTRAQIQLPEPTELLEDVETCPKAPVSGQPIYSIKEHMTKFFLSGNPTTKTSDCVVVATAMTTFRRLFVCRLGDRSWTRLILKPRRIDYDHCEGISDITFFQGKIYATADDGQHIVIVDYDDGKESNFRVVRHVQGPSPRDYSELNILSTHLVECSGNLLMVFKRGRLPADPDDGPPLPQTALFELSRFEKINTHETWSRIYTIGEDRCLFLGQNASVSIPAAEAPGCKPNCIYYLDHWHESRDDDDEEATNFGYKIDNKVFSLEENRIDVDAIRFPNLLNKCWTWPAMWYLQNI